MTHSPRTIAPVLVVDDDTDDCLIAMEAWEENGLGNDLRFVQGGVELMDYLYHRGQYVDLSRSPRPGLILLDLSMFPKTGMEALAEIKADPTLCDIPVVVLSISNSPSDASRAYSLGALSFVTKPGTFCEYLSVMRDLSQIWLEMRIPRKAIIPHSQQCVDAEDKLHMTCFMARGPEPRN